MFGGCEALRDACAPERTYERVRLMLIHRTRRRAFNSLRHRDPAARFNLFYFARNSPISRISLQLFVSRAQLTFFLDLKHPVKYCERKRSVVVRVVALGWVLFVVYLLC